MTRNPNLARVLSLTDVDLRGQRVLVREDFNVPIENGIITSDTRLKAALPTLKMLIAQGARTLIISHMGRPTEGEFDANLSLAPVAKALSHLLDQPVKLIDNWLDGVELKAGEVALAENVRFLPGENKDDPVLAQRMAALCDIFVMDAFATAHRAQASTHGIIKYAPKAVAGPLLMAELDALNRSLTDPKRPLVAVVGGSKVSTKLVLLESLLNTVDTLIVGGGIANTLLAASGVAIGRSLYEPDLIDTAKRLLATNRIPLPVDVVVGKTLQGEGRVTSIQDIATDEAIFDIGPKTAELFSTTLQTAGSIVWNGPVGVFEQEAFAKGTQVIAQAIANSPAFSIAGGGDTLAAVEKFNVATAISYISTGGGAFLECLENKPLPALTALAARAQE